MSSPRTTLDALLAPPERGRRGLLVRHAPRDEILSATDVLEARLTPAGIAAARDFGRRLAGFGPIVAWHSPIVRCTETATALLDGVADAGGSGVLAGPLPAIGGPYLTDPVAAMTEFVQGVDRFVRRWFDGRYGRELVLPRREASRLQLVGIVAAWQAEPTAALAVFVTHDLNVLAIREEILGLRHEEAGWIDCLDGLRLALDEDVLELAWEERVARIPVAQLAGG